MKIPCLNVHCIPWRAMDCRAQTSDVHTIDIHQLQLLYYTKTFREALDAETIFHSPGIMIEMITWTMSHYQTILKSWCLSR